MKKMKLFAAVFLTAATTLSVPVTTQAAFDLHYVHSSAPKGANVVTATENVKCKGKSYVTLKCTKYKSQVEGVAYVTEKCNSSQWEINPVPVSSKGETKIKFKSNSKPRKGLTLEFIVSLEGVSNTNPATIKGKMY